MLERRRCHPLYIVEQLARYVGLIVIYIFYLLMQIFDDGGIANLAEFGYGILSVVGYVILSALGLLALITFFVWLGWRNKWISAEDNTLIYESGVLVKKRVTIPFSKINTIDMGRNLFQRIVGTCRLKVDTGAIESGAEAKAEMNIVFSLKDAEEFRSYILNRSAQDTQELRQEGATAINAGTEPRWAARARFSDFLMYGLTSSSIWKLLCMVVVAVCFLAELSASILDMAVDAVTPLAESIWNFISGSGIILIILYVLIAFIAITLISGLFSVVYAAIRYFGFRVAREGDNVVVRYGLLTLKNYTVQAENVHAVVIRQNLLQQLIGRCSVEMISIGYGNEENETNLLFPIIQTKKLGWLIDTLLPEYSLSVETRKPEKRSIRFVIVRPIVWVLIFLALGVFGCKLIMDSVAIPVIAAIAILASVVLGSILSYRSNAIGCDGKVLLARNGGLKCVTHLIRVDAVQSVAATSGVFQRPAKVASYRVDFHAPALRNIAVVPHMNDDLLHELDAYLLK